MELAKRKCVPCEGGIQPFSPEEAQTYLEELGDGWGLVDTRKKLRKEFSFRDFKEAIAFVNRVAEVAEEEGHHPDMHVFYNKVVIELWTHAIGGLSENDFILAAKINGITRN